MTLIMLTTTLIKCVFSDNWQCSSKPKLQDSLTLKDTSLDSHPPVGAIIRSQARWMPPLDLSSWRSRGHPLIQGGTHSSLRHHILASLDMSRQCVLIVSVAWKKLETRSASFGFLPEIRWVGDARAIDFQRRARARALGHRAPAICASSVSFERLNAQAPDSRVLILTDTHTPKRCSKIHPPSPLLVLGKTK